MKGGANKLIQANPCIAKSNMPYSSMFCFALKDEYTNVDLKGFEKCS